MRGSILLAFIAAVGASPTPQSPTKLPPLLPGQLTSNVTYGPAPKGCSKYELIIGMIEPFPCNKTESRLILTSSSQLEELESQDLLER
jgi:hypothetical protein